MAGAGVVWGRLLGVGEWHVGVIYNFVKLPKLDGHGSILQLAQHIIGIHAVCCV